MLCKYSLMGIAYRKFYLLNLYLLPCFLSLNTYILGDGNQIPLLF